MSMINNPIVDENIDETTTTFETTSTSTQVAPSLFDPLSLTGFDAVDKSKSESGKGSGALSIIYAEKNSKNITFGKELYERIGSPKRVYILMDGDHLIIGNALAEISPAGRRFTDYLVRCANQSKDRGKIYNAELVAEIIRRYGIQITGVCKTFYEVEYVDHGGYTFARVNLKNN